MQVEQKHHTQGATDGHARQQSQQFRFAHIPTCLQQATEGGDKIQHHQQRDDLRQRHEQNEHRPCHQCRTKACDTENDIGHDDTEADHQPLNRAERPLAHQLKQTHG